MVRPVEERIDSTMSDWAQNKRDVLNRSQHRQWQYRFDRPRKYDGHLTVLGSGQVQQENKSSKQTTKQAKRMMIEGNGQEQRESSQPSHGHLFYYSEVVPYPVYRADYIEFEYCILDRRRN